MKLYALRRSKNTASNACGVFAFAAHSDVDAAFLADGALQELGTVDVMFAPSVLPKIGKNMQKHGEKHGKICRISLEKAEKCVVILLYRKC